MYTAFFGFSKTPFDMSPDPAFLFRSAQHEEALSSLIYGVQTRKGFIVLTGEVGTGKTTMLECLRDYLNAQRVAFASLFNSRLTVEQFFEMLAYDLDLHCNRLSKTEVLLSLNHLLMERATAGRTTVLIVDEAHNLGWDVLEEIRSEEHTSELQSLRHLVCRLLLEKKKKKKQTIRKSCITQNGTASMQSRITH